MLSAVTRIAAALRLLVVKHTEAPGDTPATLMRKQVTFSFFAAWLIFSQGALPLLWWWDYGGLLFFLCCTTIATCFLVCTTLVVLKRLTTAMLALIMAVTFSQIALSDVAFAVAGSRSWTIFVVLLDLLLVVEAPGIAKWVAAGACLHVVVINLERLLRVGLFDIPGTQPDADRLNCCENPPCSVGLPQFAVTTGIELLTFVLDYYVTRFFALEALRERARMASAAQAAQEVARCLGRFDLSAAEAALAKPNVPPGSAVVLRVLLVNLSRYRPYLPQSVLCEDGDDGDGGGDGGDGSSDAEAYTDAADGDLVTTEVGDVVYDPKAERGYTGVCSGSYGTTSPVSDTIERSLGSGSSDRPPLPLPSPTTRLVCTLRRKTLSLLSMTLAHDGFSKEHADPEVAAAAATSFGMDAYVQAHSEFIEALLTFSAENRGLVENFAADTAHASFNVSSRCACHGGAASRTGYSVVVALRRVGCTAYGSVGSGRALAGVLGTSTLCRLSVVGGLPLFVAQMSRAAWLLNVGLVCNAAAFSEAWALVELRLMLHTFLLDDGRTGGSAGGGGGGGGDTAAGSRGCRDT
eukprot:Rhum_TRINITY_DN7770_c0_g1::Rhum_TRINITY_DN7770_c0_g1_i1::g.24551::m.24551